MKISRHDWTSLWSYRKIKRVLNSPFRDILSKLGQGFLTRLEQGPVEKMWILKGLIPSFFSPLTSPRWIPAGKATHMHPEDPILGLIVEGNSYALPWWIMKNHHAANLILAGRPFLINLCEACTSATAFNPVVNNRRLTFRLAGYYNGTWVAKDYETDTIWAPFTGEALVGPLQGTHLEWFPLYQSTWAEWLALHPASVVLDGQGESREGHGHGVTPGSPEEYDVLMNTIVHRDDRLSYNQLVVGVAINGHARAYPLAQLNKLVRPINDSLGAEELVLLFKPQSCMAMAYSRRVNSECLNFDLDEEGNLVDRNTMTRWNLSGRAISGPLAGRTLSPFYSIIEEWYVWASYHPGTAIYEGASTS